MRAMRLGKREVADGDAIREIIDSCQVLRIGAVDEEGMFIVPVNFGFRWNGPEGDPRASFYVHSAREGRKAEAFRAHGAAGTPVAFELDRDGGTISGDYSCAYSRAYASVMGTGVMVPVEDEDERLRGLELIMRHTAPGAPVSFSPAGLGRVAVFRLDARELTAKRRA